MGLRHFLDWPGRIYNGIAQNIVWASNSQDLVYFSSIKEDFAHLNQLLNLQCPLPSYLLVRLYWRGSISNGNAVVLRGCFFPCTVSLSGRSSSWRQIFEIRVAGSLTAFRLLAWYLYIHCQLYIMKMQNAHQWPRNEHGKSEGCYRATSSVGYQSWPCRWKLARFRLQFLSDPSFENWLVTGEGEDVGATLMKALVR